MRYAVYPTDKMKLVTHIVKRDVRRYLRWKHSWKVSTAALGIMFVGILLGWNVLHSAASSYTMVPDGDITVGWSRSSGTTNYSNVDDGTTDNTADYVSAASTDTTASLTDQYSLTSPPDVSTASQVILTMYLRSTTNANGGTMDTISLNLIVNGTPQTVTTCTPTMAWATCTATYTGSWNQAAVDSMQVSIVRNILGSGKASGQPDNLQVSDIYGSLTYTSSLVLNQSAYRWFNNKDEASAGTLSIANQAEYYATGAPKGVATGDFNGDGHDDIVTTNGGGSGVSVIMNNGDGTFATNVDYAVGSSPYGVAVGDVNGDGHPDIVTANAGIGANNVSILINNGNGTFATQTTEAVGTTPYSVAIADVNGDGKLDIVTANNGSNNVSVLLGNGDGTFATQVTYSVGTAPTSVAIADVNGDGKPDLVVANGGTTTISILLGNGNGTFASQTTATVDNGPLSLVVADFNGDGKQDIATVTSSDTYCILLGNGDGTFASQLSTSLGVAMQSVTAADFNGDGKQDMAISFSGTSDRLGVLTGNGDGTFGSPNYYVPDRTPTGIATDDFNGDGRPDIVLTNLNASTVSVYINTLAPPIDVNAPLAAQDTAATAPAEGTIFRLRLNLNVTGSQLDANTGSFKLQFAEKGAGTCSSPAGSYADVTDTSVGIRYADNTVASSGISLATNANDPLYNGETSNTNETYQEKGTTTFTNPTAISVGQDGMWDFGLVAYHSIQNTTYCFKVVKGDGSALTTYTQYPTITMPAANIGVAAYRWYNPAPAGTSLTFAKTYGDSGYGSWVNDITATSDGGYVTTGAAGYTSSYSSDDMQITKYAADGTVSWTRYWGSTSHLADQGYAVIQTSDGGYAVTGTTSSFGAGNTDMFIVKYNSDGSTAWSQSQVWGSTGYESGADIAQLTNGDLIVTGTYGSNTDLFTARYNNTTGAYISGATWGSTSTARSIAATSDGGYVIVGGTSDMYIAKFASNDTLTWSYTWGGSSTDYANSVIQTSDGGYAVVGLTDSIAGESNEAFLVKLDSTGTIKWNVTVGGTNGADSAYAVTQTSDGGYAVTGTVGSYGAGATDVFLAKVVDNGTSGTVSWTKTFGSTAQDAGMGVIQTSDGGYVVGGSYNGGPSSTTARDLLLKYDSSGSIAGCVSPMCQSPSMNINSVSGTRTALALSNTGQTSTQSSVNASNEGFGLTDAELNTLVGSADPIGNPFAAQNKPLDLTSLTPVALRLAVSVDDSGFNINDTTNFNLKLQFAPLIGATSCSALSSGSYSDVTTTSALKYYDDSRYSSGQAISTDVADPTDGNRTMMEQTYQESNNFTNSQSALYAGQDGIWQFSLAIDSATLKGRAFCIRVATSGGTQLSASNIAEVANSTQSFQRLRQGNWWNQEGVRQYINL